VNDEQFFLANAYLDGELTDDERVFANADPVVLAEVERLRALQAGVRTVDPPSSVAKERAINAALDAFRVAGVSLQPGRQPVRHYARYVGIAAAIVAIGLLGVVIAKGGNDSGSDDAARESSALASPAADSDLTRQAGGPDDIAASDTFDVTEALAAEAAPESAAVTAEASAQAGAVDAATLSVAEPLTSPADLAAYAAYVEQFPDSNGTPISPETRCPFPSDDDPSGVIAQTTYLMGGVVRDVLVAVDRATGQAFALEPTTCLVLVEGPLP
jgi:hypothetical protein